MIKGFTKKELDEIFSKSREKTIKDFKLNREILKETKKTNALLKNLIGLLLIQENLKMPTNWNGNKGVYYGR